MVRFNGGGCTREFLFEGIAEKEKRQRTPTTYYYFESNGSHEESTKLITSWQRKGRIALTKVSFAITRGS